MKKTSYIVFGNQKKKKLIEAELEKNPLMMYSTKIKQAEEEKYLGWYISEKSLSDCSYLTVMKRKGKVISTIHQIKAIVEDSRSARIGSIRTGLTIW